MASFSRKIKRRKFVKDRKQFMKDFKDSMRKFKNQIKCTDCGRPPYEGEKIDNWHINKESQNIDLVCLECHDSEKGENET